MKFKIKPKEIFTVKYWLHLGVLGFIVLLILQMIQGENMLTVKNVLLSIPITGAGDIIAHTLLGID